MRGLVVRWSELFSRKGRPKGPDEGRWGAMGPKESKQVVTAAVVVVVVVVIRDIVVVVVVVVVVEWAKMRQDDSNEDIKSFKIPKSQYLVMSLIVLDG